MLHKETIHPFLEEILSDLMLVPELKKFYLVGGTALSLQLGHRKSDDIDLFTPDQFKVEELISKLRRHYPHNQFHDLIFGFSIYLPIPGTPEDELKIDIMSNEKFIRPFILEDGIRIAHLEDIAAMKLEAITTRSVKKDYWDIAELLEKYSLNQMLGFYKERYPWNDIKPVMERIIRFDLCEKMPDPIVLKKVSWNDVKNKIALEFDRYVFAQIHRTS
jgi:predicted nucleotidyltransferase component of viral defense system